MKHLNDMTPEEVVEEYDRRGRREGWPPAEPKDRKDDPALQPLIDDLAGCPARML